MRRTADICRARAEEAESLSRTVAYEPDRARLRGEAAHLREQAARMDAHDAEWRTPAPRAGPGLLARWFGRR